MGEVHMGEAGQASGVGGMSKLAIVVVALLVLATAAAGLYIGSRRMAAARQKELAFTCQQRLEKIKSALLAYANEQRGRYPDQIAGALAMRNQSGLETWCPTADQRGGASGPGAYIYLGKGKTMIMQNRHREVLLYESLQNHGGAGLHVVYCDGTVKWLDRAEAQQLLSGLAGGAGNARQPAGH